MPRSLAYDPRNALNAICPYFTMFPLEFPFRVLKAHRKDQPIVMDPFCGRGTTLFAARQLRLVARGIDSSPVAVAIARAKLCKVDIDKTLDLAHSYIHTTQVGEMPTSEFFRYGFDPLVLRQICAVREALLKVRRDTDSTVLLRAAMLGCLHGPTSKSIETQAYFSNQMPRTYGAKPDYSIRYWKNKGLIPPKTNVLAVLRRKLSRLSKAESEPPEKVALTDARLGDSRFAASLPTAKRDFSVVVTSPPYYGMRTYLEDQWLRNWFLGGPDHVQYGVADQLEHAGQDSFAESLGAVWRNMARTRSDNLHMYIRFGIIQSAKRLDPKKLIRTSLEASGISWKVISTRNASTADSGKRQANLMSTDSSASAEYDFHVCRN